MGWSGPVFRLSQNYPTTLPALGTAPWRQIDFRTQSTQYLKAVLTYALARNTAVDFRGQDNTVRKCASKRARWIYFCSPPCAWEQECGREGWLLDESETGAQHAFLMMAMN